MLPYAAGRHAGKRRQRLACTSPRPQRRSFVRRAASGYPSPAMPSRRRRGRGTTERVARRSRFCAGFRWRASYVPSYAGAIRARALQVRDLFGAQCEQRRPLPPPKIGLTIRHSDLKFFRRPANRQCRSRRTRARRKPGRAVPPKACCEARTYRWYYGTLIAREVIYYFRARARARSSRVSNVKRY